MNKTLIGTVIAAWALTGCASMTYEARCAQPLEKEPSASAVKSASDDIRGKYLYTERLHYSSDEFVIFADKTGRNMEATTGSAQFIKGQGSIMTDASFSKDALEFVSGEFNISQTNPKCYSLTQGDVATKSFLATSSQQYPLASKDENESAWKVGYFDYYQPQRLENDGALKLTHKDSAENLVLESSGGDFFVNGDKARLVIDRKTPLAEFVLEVESTGDTYAIIGTVRKGSEGRYFIWKNKEVLLAFNGPNR